MKVYLANYEPGRIGGGWTFARNFALGLGGAVSNYEDADIYFITSPSMVQREDVEKAWNDGKKIVLRIDNAVRNSRNRNTGMSRMYEFAQKADLVIYQSQWAQKYLSPFTNKKGIVILNGVDLSLYPTGKREGNNVLYSRYNRDETKNWEVARYWFSRHQLLHPDAKLYIVGQFSDELRQYNFDFYNNENYEYLGVLEPKNMAKIYGVCGKFLYTYYNDACSNSLIEALVSGCKIVGDKYYRSTGGAKEIRSKFRQHGRDYFSLDRMINEYTEALCRVVTD